MFAVFIFKRFPLMMHTLVLNVIGNHLFVAQSVGDWLVDSLMPLTYASLLP